MNELSADELKTIADTLRRDSLISTTAAGSGHPTSCLSCAEIMAVLWFKVMNYNTKNPDDEDNDEFILSKGHAAPILYSALARSGCIRDDIKTLRKAGSSLEGHPMPRSLKWVKAASGSLGQGLSVGAGMALAAKLNGRKYRTYVLLGDGEIAEGSIYEALEFAKKYSIKNICAIVDVNRLGQSGETIEGHNLDAYKRRFEAFGWRAVIVDGHDTKHLLDAFSSLKGYEKPTAILAKTFKGRGVSFMENQEGWHGRALDKEQLRQALREIPNKKMPNFSINKPEKCEEVKVKLEKAEVEELKMTKGKVIPTREAYGKALAGAAVKDRKIISIDGDVGNSTKSEEVKKVRPQQFINAFIAEQNMIGVSHGLSIKGFNVFASTFSAFLTRAHDQLRMAAVSSPRNNLTVCGSHSGVSIGADGVSQMGLEDIAFFRTLPNSTIFYPSDAVSTKKIVELCASGNGRKIPGIKYIRTTKNGTPVIYDIKDRREKFEAGKFKVIKESAKDSAVLIGAGVTLHECLSAYKELRKKGINTAVIDLYCIKPLNGRELREFILMHGSRCIVAEDHHPEGGIGDAVRSALGDSGDAGSARIRTEHLAVHGIPHSGTTEELLRTHGIDAKSIVNKVSGMIK
ncbi:transketolase [Candidatus Pacearchaeota archaeon]|nr:transketolase [Candidatus Pacearchaeota archaeon]